MQNEQHAETDVIYQERFEKFSTQSDILQGYVDKLKQSTEEITHSDKRHIFLRLIAKGEMVLEYCRLIKEQKNILDKLVDRNEKIKAILNTIVSFNSYFSKINTQAEQNSSYGIIQDDFQSNDHNIDKLYSILNILKTENIILTCQDSLKRINAIEDAARLSAGATADYEIAKFFNDLESTYDKSSNEWLIKIQWIIGIIVLCIFLIDPIYSGLQCLKLIYLDGDQKIYSYFTTKISLLATSLVILFFSIKNYNINKHNSIINKYKAVIMKTLPAISAQYPDADKKIFLNKLSDFLFGTQDTGMNKNTDPGMPNDKLIDMLTKTLGKAKD